MPPVAVGMVGVNGWDKCRPPEIGTPDLFDGHLGLVVMNSWINSSVT
jgi:hypothetical protein